MAKTKEQTKRHLRSCDFSGLDWEMVLELCRQEFGGGSVHKSINPEYKSTFSDFKEWFDNGFGSGDIVRYGKLLCIVSDETPVGVVISVKINSDGEIDTDPDTISRFRLSDTVGFEKKWVEDVLKFNGYSFSQSLSRLVKSYKPKPYERVSVRIRGKQYNGIFESATPSTVSLLLYISDGKIVNGYNGEADVNRINKEGIKEIDDVLAANGLMWNYREHKVEKIIRRAKKGDTYWYISDKFTLVSGKDTYNLSHNARFKRGNYFVNYRDGLEFLVKIMEMRKTKGCD